jgi:hypothetical protein
MKEETTNSLRASIVGALATVEISVPTNWQPVGYSGQTALRREQCDMTAETRMVELRNVR